VPEWLDAEQRHEQVPGGQVQRVLGVSRTPSFCSTRSMNGGARVPATTAQYRNVANGGQVEAEAASDRVSRFTSVCTGLPHESSSRVICRPSTRSGVGHHHPFWTGQSLLLNEEGPRALSGPHLTPKQRVRQGTRASRSSRALAKTSIGATATPAPI
jgi:hypothetical protein